MENKIEYSKPVPPFVKFCAANIPMVFDDSLSYYEALCALWKFLQSDVIDVINNNAEVTQIWREELTEFEGDMTDKFNDLNDAFDTLKNWIDNYFENLDVQEEINHKLDIMAEDGTLEDLLNAIVNTNEKVFYYVEDYGAAGDGTTDDSAAINAAFADAKNKKGTVTFKTQNTYRIDSPIYIPQGCSLYGNGCTILSSINEYAIYVNSTAEDNNTETVGRSFSILRHFNLESTNESFTEGYHGIHFACHGTVQYVTFYKIDKCVRFAHGLYIDNFRVEFCMASTRTLSSHYAFDLGSVGDGHTISNVQQTASGSTAASQPKFIYIGAFVLNSVMDNIIGNGIIDVAGECAVSNLMLTYYGFLNVTTQHKNVTINNVYASIDEVRAGRINLTGNHIVNLNNCRFISNYVQTGHQDLVGFPITYSNNDHIYVNQCSIGTRTSTSSANYATLDLGEMYGHDLVQPTIKNGEADYATSHLSFSTNTNPSGTLNGTYTYTTRVVFDTTRLIGKAGTKTGTASPANKGVQLTNFAKNLPIYLERQATNNDKHSVYVYSTNTMGIDNGSTFNGILWSDDLLDTASLNTGFSKVIFNGKNVIAFADSNFSAPNGTWTKNDLIVAANGIKKFDGTNWV